jgi:hypothetical protein
MLVMVQSNTTPPVLDYAASDAIPLRSHLRMAVIFCLAAWLTGFLPLAAWAALLALYEPDTEHLLLPILTILLTLILLPELGILLASVAVMRRFTRYRTPRSWRAAASAGAIYTILLAVMAAACSTQALHDAVGGSGDAAFAIFAVGAILILILLSRWLMKRNDGG